MGLEILSQNKPTLKTLFLPFSTFFSSGWDGSIQMQFFFSIEFYTSKNSYTEIIC